MRGAVRRLTTGLTALVAVCGATQAREAHACSGGRHCSNTVFPVGGTVPANAPAFEVFVERPRGGPAELGDVHILRLGGDASTELPYLSRRRDDSNFDLIPTEPLREGDVLSLGARCEGWNGSRQNTFTVAAPAPLPTRLGALRRSGAFRTTATLWPVPGSGCWAPVPVVVEDVRVQLTDDAAPWHSLFAYQALVDGVVSPGLADERALFSNVRGETFAGRGVIRIAALCPSPSQFFDHRGLPEGPHTVQFRARVAGTDHVVESDTVTVHLSCLNFNTQPALAGESQLGGGGGGGSGCGGGPSRAPVDAGLPVMGVAIGAGVLRRRRDRR